MKLKNWLPNQHGAWAFIVTPTIYAFTVAGHNIWQIALLLNWVLAYSLNFYLMLYLKTHKLQRYLKQMLLYFVLTASLAAVIVLKFPSLLTFAPIFLVGFLVNTHYVRTKNERSISNDFVGIILSITIGYFALSMGANEIQRSWNLALLVISLYFGGTVFYVKTMIREKDKKSWLIGSVLWHVGSLTISTLFDKKLFWVFLVMLIRSIYFPRIKIKPKVVGIIEIFITSSLYLTLITL